MTDSENKKIGEWLCEKRKEHGYTQQQIADKLGMAKSMVSRWENGKRTIYADQFLNYCHAIGMTSEEMQELVNL